MKDHHRHNVLICPACGYEADCSARMEGEKKEQGPRPGDLTLCLACGALCEYGAGPVVTLRLFPEADFNLLPEEQKVAIRFAQNARKRIVTPKVAERMRNRSKGKPT